MSFRKIEKISFYKELDNNGYIILKNVFQNDLLNVIRDLTDKVSQYADLNLEDPFIKYYQPHRSDQGVLFDLYQRHPEYQIIANNSRVLDALELLLGKNIFLYENSLVYKPKGKENAVPWHQDFISRPNEPDKYIAWTALDNITKENGALKVIPSSHKKGYLAWHRVEGETHHSRLNTDLIDESTATYVEMNAGDVLIFCAKLVHGSDKTDSKLPRRAYRVSYQNFDSIATPRATPIVVRGGTPEELIKLYPNNYQEINKPIYKRALNKIGKILYNI